MIKIKVGPNGKLPTKGSNGAAGYDLYCATDVHIQSGGREQIPLDIYSEFDKGIVASIRDRSGIAKDGLFIAAGTIDSDYRGPWSVIMWNFSDEDVAFRKGDRVAQVLFLRLDESELIQTNELNMTERGSSGFGSTGK